MPLETDASSRECDLVLRSLFDVRGSSGKRAVISAARLRDPECAEEFGPVVQACYDAALPRLDGLLHPVGFVCGPAPVPADVALRSKPVKTAELPAAISHLNETRPCARRVVADRTASLLRSACGHLDAYIEKAVDSGAPLAPIDSEKWLLLSHSVGGQGVAKAAAALVCGEVSMQKGLLWRGGSVLIPTSALLGCKLLDEVLEASRCGCGARMAGQCYFCKDCLDHATCTACAGEGHACSRSLGRAMLSHVVHKMSSGRKASFAQIDDSLMVPMSTGMAMLWPCLPSTAWAGVSAAVVERARVLFPSLLLCDSRVVDVEGEVCVPSIKEQLQCLCEETPLSASGRRKKKKLKKPSPDFRVPAPVVEKHANAANAASAAAAANAAAAADAASAEEGAYECPVCMESLFDSGLRPVVLPDCGHWLCTRCSGKLREPKCPRCNTRQKTAPVRLFL